MRALGPAKRGRPTESHPARRLLRVSFGLIWIFDGILQGQASMPLGMAPQVIAPAAAVSPGWVQHLDNAMATIWSYHPIAAPASAVWIQVGIGVWLLVGARGDWSRLAGVASVGVGPGRLGVRRGFRRNLRPRAHLAVRGARGGAVLLPGRRADRPSRAYWATPRLGRLRCSRRWACSSSAWPSSRPGRAGASGRARHAEPPTPGTLTAMVRRWPRHLSRTSCASWVAAFGASTPPTVGPSTSSSWSPWPASGPPSCSGRPRSCAGGVVAGVVLCLADWVLVEDLGFLGGVGTDPNSMIPMALVFVAGYLAIDQAAGRRRARQPTVRQLAAAGPLATGGSGWPPTRPTPSGRSPPSARWASLWSAPCQWPWPRPTPTPTRSSPRRSTGRPNATDTPAPAFDLVDQHGQPVSLASLRGKAVALTFLDPVCTSDCPRHRPGVPRRRQHPRRAGAPRRRAGRHRRQPPLHGTGYLLAFDHQEDLDNVPNWLYLTGSLPQLEHVWDVYGVQVAYEPGGAMIDHSEMAYVIDRRGHTRYILDTDPGPATEATKSSFSATLASALESALRPGRQ